MPNAMGGKPTPPNPNRPQHPRKPGNSFLNWLFFVMLVALGSIFFFSEDTPSETVDWTTFQTMMEKDAFQKVTVYTGKGYI